MLRLQKTALTLFVLGTSSVFAGTMGPICTPGNVTVPCASRAWDIGGQALYLQSTFNKDFSYVPSNNPAHYQDLSGRWAWGFQLEGSYHFNTGNDATLTWYHLDTNNSNLSFNTTVSSAIFNSAVKNRWDAVNGELGQMVHFGPLDKSIRFHGGFQYARIKPSIGFFLVNTNLSYRAGIADESQYNGFGPRTGLDLNYELGSGLGIYAKAATALLVGTSKLDVTLFNGNTSEIVHASGSKTAVVPELETRLGAKYTYAMPQGDLTLDAGYMWFNYFNAFSNIALSDAMIFGTSDYGAAGPYFGLKYLGNI